MIDKELKVSVCMITYNHEEFIAQALDSVLMQETDFEYEIVIGDDCSTDRTREIVSSYYNRYPDKIKLLLPEKNLGVHENLARTLSACRGENIALLEGDDFWTASHKLQSQVDFLTSHPECSMCFHPVKWFYDESWDLTGGPEDNSAWPASAKEFSDIEDIIKEIFIQTGSVMVRNRLLDGYPDWIRSLYMADWPLFILYAQFGKIGCLNEVMGAHRKHAGGTCYKLGDEKIYKDMIRMYEAINAHTSLKYRKIIAPILADYYFKLGELYERLGDPKSALAYLRTGLRSQLLNRQRPNQRYWKMLARVSFPAAFKASRKIAGSLGV